MPVDGTRRVQRTNRYQLARMQCRGGARRNMRARIITTTSAVFPVARGRGASGRKCKARSAGKRDCRERSTEAGNTLPLWSRRRLEELEAVRAADCRECSAEAGNTVPPCLIGSSSKKRPERSAVENARQRQVTPYPFVSPKARVRFRQWSKLGIAGLAGQDADRRAKRVLLRQEKNNLQKEIFLKNCMNFLAIQGTYGIVKKGCELVTCEFSDSVLL